MDFKWETAKPAQPAMVSLYGSAMAAHPVWITLAQRDSDSNIAHLFTTINYHLRKKTLSGDRHSIDLARDLDMLYNNTKELDMKYTPETDNERFWNRIDNLSIDTEQSLMDFWHLIHQPECDYDSGMLEYQARLNRFLTQD